MVGKETTPPELQQGTAELAGGSETDREIRIEPRTLKGFNDYLPEAAARREWIMAELRRTFSSWGYVPLETPALEYADVLLGRYGAEAEKLIYRFNDMGGRDVALRYDQTVPFARVIAQYRDLPRPFRRYQFQRVWRGENTGRGREREFTQCDVDTAGAPGVVADAETICVAAEGFRAIGFNRVKVLVNDRTLFDGLGLTKGDVIAIDKLAKIGEDGVVRELASHGRTEASARDILHRLQASPAPARLHDVLSAARDLGIADDDLVYDPTLARGLEYYTSTILEVVSPDYTAGSLGGGGRYDRLIGRFTGRDIPAVGFSFGLERVTDALASLARLDHVRAVPDVVVIAFGSANLGWAGKVASDARGAGLMVSVSTEPDRPMGKQLETASRLGAGHAIVVGEDEASSKTATLRNLSTRAQSTASVPDVIASVKRNILHPGTTGQG
ncbi:MAG TPA: histidine--tRNA ligase [Chloroflexi bacterium]|nr:histidine--tRNA ligase [Chloroflexota bacterium]